MTNTSETLKIDKHNDPLLDMRDAVALRGWWHGCHREPALIRIPHFQADYIRGYRDGFNYLNTLQ